MSPAGNVAVASGFGAAVGGLVGFLAAFAGSKVAGATPKHAGVAIMLGMAAGAVAGAATGGSLEEKRVASSAIGAGMPLSGVKIEDGDYPIPDPFHPGCQIIFHCSTDANGRQHCTSSTKCG